MKFILNRNAKHLRAESIDGSFKNRLRALFNGPKRNIGGFAVAAALVGSLFGATPAMAAENNISDTTTQVTNEQTIDYGATQVENEAVTQVQTAAPVQTEVVQETAPVQQQVVQETAPVQAEVVQETAPVQEEVVQETTPVQEEVVQETAPVQEEVVQDAASVQETNTSSVNTEIDNRVPHVEEQINAETTTDEMSDVTNVENNSDVIFDNVQNETEVVNEEMTDVTANETNNLEENKEEITISDQQTDMGVVSENPVILDQNENSTNVDQTTEATSDKTEVTENDMTNSELTEENTETDNIENTNGEYQVISQDGSLIIVGDIPEDQLSQVIEDLTNKYGEDVVNNSSIFDHETIDSQINPGETVNLGDSGYTASKDNDGNIVVKDAEGNIIHDWKNELENSQNQTDDIYKDENGNIHIDVDRDEYFVAQDEKGDYHLVVGGVGLSPDQLNELISDLQSQGKLPEGVTPTINGLPDKDGLSVTIGDNTYTRVDGEIVITNNNKDNDTSIKDDTIDKGQSDDLEDNYQDAHNPDAEPGDKPGEDEPEKDDPEPDDPEPDDPEPDDPGTDDPEPDDPGTDDPEPDDPEPEKPEPKDPEPEKGGPTETPKSDLPNTGVADQAAAALGMAASGVALVGAGAVMNKKRKKDETEIENSKNQKLTVIDSHDDYKTLKEKLAKIYPDYDDLELTAMAWKNSQERENMNSKGRRR